MSADRSDLARLVELGGLTVAVAESMTAGEMAAGVANMFDAEGAGGGKPLNGHGR